MRTRVRFIFALGIAFMLMGVNLEPTTQFTADQRIAAIVYSSACRMTNYECSGDVPMLRRSPELFHNGIRGMFWSEGVYWVANEMTGTQLWLTAFHETVHVLQNRNGILEYDDDDLLDCMVEREALDFTNAYVDVLNAPQSFKRTVETWRELYDCT